MPSRPFFDVDAQSPLARPRRLLACVRHVPLFILPYLHQKRSTLFPLGISGRFPASFRKSHDRETRRLGALVYGCHQFSFLASTTGADTAATRCSRGPAQIVVHPDMRREVAELLDLVVLEIGDWPRRWSSDHPCPLITHRKQTATSAGSASLSLKHS